VGHESFLHVDRCKSKVWSPVLQCGASFWNPDLELAKGRDRYQND
jgi:hypothetical protein